MEHELSLGDGSSDSHDASLGLWSSALWCCFRNVTLGCKSSDSRACSPRHQVTVPLAPPFVARHPTAVELAIAINGTAMRTKRIHQLPQAVLRSTCNSGSANNASK